MEVIARRTRRPNELWETYEAKSILAAKQRATKLGRNIIKVYTPRARFFVRRIESFSDDPFWEELSEDEYMKEV